ncbi:MAG: VWA domain-containing protein [bacterium]
MRFMYGYQLWWLLIIPVMVFWYLTRRRRKATLRFSDISLLKQIRPSRSLRYRHLVFILKATAAALIILALARPQAGKKNRDITTRGIDVMLTIDASGSMRAEDFKPNNRLHVAKQVVSEFIRGRDSDQIGMVVFAGQSITQCPLTSDYSVLLSLLENVQFDMLEDGTAIGMALANCVNRLKDTRAKSKIVILLTDGQNNRGEIDPITAARIAQSFGIKVYTVGVGREGGAPIPVYDPVYGKRYIIGPDGRPVLTQMDEKTLKEIAKITGGQYFRAIDRDSLKKIYQQIDRLEKTKREVKHYMEYRELFQYLIPIALLLFTISIILENTRFRTIP